MGYGAYTVMVRVYCPRDERCFSMQLLLGYIGLVNAVALLPIALYSLASSSGSDGDNMLTWTILGFLIVKGLLDNVLSDYLWARAVVLTSATVATVGLGCTIPLAFVSDLLLGHTHVLSIRSAVGAVSVLLGFTVVNIGTSSSSSSDENENGQEQQAENTIFTIDEDPPAFREEDPSSTGSL